MTKPTYIISTVEGFEIDGEKKNRYTDIGVAWRKDNGLISCKLHSNIAVTNSFIIREPKKKDA